MHGYQVESIPIPVGGAMAVTSMLAGDDGFVYVGLTAKEHTLARIDPSDNTIEDMGKIFPIQEGVAHLQDKIHNSLVKGRDGLLYVGEGLNIADGWPPAMDYTHYRGGRLFSFDTRTGATQELGLPVAHNAIHGLTGDAARGWLYGLTIPDHHFFAFDLTSGRVTDHGRIGPYPSSHNLACTPASGAVFGAWLSLVDDPGTGTKRDTLYLTKYDPIERHFARTLTPILDGREPGFDAWNRGVDSWAITQRGLLYGGLAGSGRIFSLDPVTEQIRYVGKPLASRRVTGMVEDANGHIYGTAGFPVMHVFRYDPTKGAFEDLEAPEVAHSLCYFHGMALLSDGSLFVGETDSGRPIVYRCTPQ